MACIRDLGRWGVPMAGAELLPGGERSARGGRGSARSGRLPRRDCSIWWARCKGVLLVERMESTYTMGVYWDGYLSSSLGIHAFLMSLEDAASGHVGGRSLGYR